MRHRQGRAVEAARSAALGDINRLNVEGRRVGGFIGGGAKVEGSAALASSGVCGG
ncbi:MAG: hypothetical protein JNM76_12635 [Betaproteobacteria bacterium]|nr:hypothetical protein [Betaproteobacteria bacterium]